MKQGEGTGPYYRLPIIFYHRALFLTKLTLELSSLRKAQRRKQYMCLSWLPFNHCFAVLIIFLRGSLISDSAVFWGS